MKIKNFIISIIFIVASINELSGEAIKPSSIAIEDNYLIKELPLYRFKDNEIGKFLDEFCDSCTSLSPQDRPTLSYANPNCIIRQTPKRNGSVRDYICIYTYWPGETLFNTAQGIIRTSEGTLCILTNINDDFIQTLQLIKVKDNHVIKMPDREYPMMTSQVGIVSLFYIPSNKNFNIVSILVNNHPVQEMESPTLNWLKQVIDKYKL